jgi:glycosyltransferase involved in cell wall biosynthesis/ubiquinone/menaquinone biosynthesis C-methylase UbiE
MSSYWRHWFFVTSYRAWRRATSALRRVLHSCRARLSQFVTVARQQGVGAASRGAVRWSASVVQVAAGGGAGQPSDAESRLKSSNERLQTLDRLIAEARPVPFSAAASPSPTAPVPGVGAYLRLDFWAKIESGGSYGHTCYVAKELAAVTERFAVFTAHRYRLIDEYGLRQVVLDGPTSCSEEDIVRGTDHFLPRVRPVLEALRPAYIYERICIGNYVGAILSRELSIPYVVEYNGSEISMRRSFDGVGYVYEYEYLKAEALAFAQATMISVVSEEVKSSLIKRGVDPDKILVNPNGADLHAYAPASRAERIQIRRELGFDELAPVVGFTGTFGGWHGIDVLAAALPEICRRVPHARWLLIGDGNYKHLVDAAITNHKLQDVVTCVGRVPQAEGARLLKACDIYVSPHSSHMVDSKFFGSPTKIFEYMAMAGAIVASDLEQIGQILSPALRVHDFAGGHLEVTDERAVLCTPADVREFVEAVVELCERPHLWPVLGRNSRLAVEQHYSWGRHVARLWPFLAGDRRAAVTADLEKRIPRTRVTRPVEEPSLMAAAIAPSAAAPKVITGDRYKDEVQKQWDNDPAGSHYVAGTEPHTLEWFLKAQSYRYDEYAPWMHDTMGFSRYTGKRVLEIGGGMGTDLAQFAQHGALVTDVDLSSGHLELAKENFRLRNLSGEFVLHDAERLPFPDHSFDVVYSNGVIHHTPNTKSVVEEIYRVLKPGGEAVIMVYAENSLHYWRNLVYAIGLKEAQLDTISMGEIMSRSVERSDNANARPLVKVYTKRRLQQMFARFEITRIVQRQMVAAEKPRFLQWVPLPTLGKWMGWNLIIIARKPAPLAH